MTPTDIARAKGTAARAQLFATAARSPAWNLRGEAGAAIAAHAAGPEVMAFWWEEDEDPDQVRGYEVVTTDSGDVAVVYVHGALLDMEPTWWSRYLGYGSLPAIARAVRTAAEDSNISAILLHVDSPGGMVSGLHDVCEAVWQVRQAGEKPVWAACREACSAAMEIASQAERRYLSPDGMGVCLGTIILLSDWSGYYSTMGVAKYRITSDGAETYKGEGAFGTEVTEPQRADFKRQCNEYRDIFDEILARGTGLSTERIRELADGRVHVGRNAVALGGLFDGVATPEAVLAALGGDETALTNATTNAPPAGTEPPPDDDDDDAEDKTEASSRPANQRPQENPMGIFGNRPKPAPAANGTPENTNDNNAADTAAQAALNAAERQELTDLRAFQTRMLTRAREAANASAVAAFGQGTDKLKRAQNAINATTDVEALADMAEGYDALIPASFQAEGNGGAAKGEPQTKPAPTTPTDEKADEEFFASIRAAGEQANGTGASATAASSVAGKGR